MIRQLTSLPLRGIGAVLMWMVWRIALDRSSHRGVSLAINSDAPDTSKAQVIDALDLIARLDPKRFATIPRLLPGGIVLPERQQSLYNSTWPLAWYDQRRKACFLGSDHVANGGTAEVALSIVHELCHARLDQAGFEYEEVRRLRIEKICVRRELAFARLIEQDDPNASALVARRQKSLDDLREDDYTDARFAAEARRQRLEQLRGLRGRKSFACLRRRAILKTRADRLAKAAALRDAASK